MKRPSGLILFAVVLILLTLGWFIAGELSDNSFSEPTNNAAQTKPIINSSSYISSISYLYDGQMHEFVLEKGRWIYVPDPSVPIRDDLIQTMAETISALSPAREIMPAEGEMYGFSDDSLRITACTDVGETFFLTFGGVNATTSQVYVRLNDNESLYLFDEKVPDAFCYGFLDLIRTDSPPDIASSELTRLTINRDRHILELSYYENSLSHAYSSAFTWFIGRPYNDLTAADTRKSHALFNDVTNFYIYGCAAFRPDTQLLEKMGLTAPRASITIDYALDGRNLQSILYVGSETADGKVYIRFNDSEQVLLADAALMESTIYTSASSLLPNAICLIQQERVTEFIVEFNGSKQHYVRNTDGYLCNDEPCSAESIDQFFALLNNTASTQLAPDTKPTDVYASIRFLQNHEKYSEMSLIFYHYDDERLLVSFDGRTQLLIPRSDIEDLLVLLLPEQVITNSHTHST